MPTVPFHSSPLPPPLPPRNPLLYPFPPLAFPDKLNPIGLHPPNDREPNEDHEHGHGRGGGLRHFSAADHPTDCFVRRGLDSADGESWSTAEPAAPAVCPRVRVESRPPSECESGKKHAGMLQSGGGAAGRAVVIRVAYAVDLDMCGVDLMVDGDAASTSDGGEGGEAYGGRNTESEKCDDATTAAVAPLDGVLNASSKPIPQVSSSTPSTKPTTNGANMTSDVAEARRRSLGQRKKSSNRLRLTIPRIAIRACSSAAVAGDAQLVLEPKLCLGGSRGGAESRTKMSTDVGDGRRSSSGGVLSGGGLPSIAIAAEWLEGHLEMEDTGFTTFAPPQKKRGLFGGPPLIGGIEQASSPVVATSEKSAWQEDAHRLRWLSVRKVSVGIGQTGIERMTGDECRSASNVDEVGVNLDGVWAEWSPPLFFLAGKAGATVSVAGRGRKLQKIFRDSFSQVFRLATSFTDCNCNIVEVRLLSPEFSAHVTL